MVWGQVASASECTDRRGKIGSPGLETVFKRERKAELSSASNLHRRRSIPTDKEPQSANRTHRRCKVHSKGEFLPCTSAFLDAHSRTLSSLCQFAGKVEATILQQRRSAADQDHEKGTFPVANTGALQALHGAAVYSLPRVLQAKLLDFDTQSELQQQEVARAGKQLFKVYGKRALQSVSQVMKILWPQDQQQQQQLLLLIDLAAEQQHQISFEADKQLDILAGQQQDAPGAPHEVSETVFA